VPLLGITLSCPLPVIALVSHYLTNKLIGRRPVIHRNRLLETFIPSFLKKKGNHQELAHLSMSYACVNGVYLRVTNPFAGILAEARTP
jgi:hypothetical protein